VNIAFSAEQSLKLVQAGCRLEVLDCFETESSPGSQ
jgi:hypothetical protein